MICPNNEMVLRQIVKQKAELMFLKDARLTDLEMSLSWKKFKIKTSDSARLLLFVPEHVLRKFHHKYVLVWPWL